MIEELPLRLTEEFLQNLNEALIKYHKYLLSDKLKEEEEQELYGKMLMIYSSLSEKLTVNKTEENIIKLNQDMQKIIRIKVDDKKVENLIKESDVFINVVNKIVK